MAKNTSAGNRLKQNRVVFAACEALEERRLFVAFQLYVDGNPVSGPTTVNYGTVEQNSTGPTHSMSFKYLGDLTVNIRTTLFNGNNAFGFVSGDQGFKTLSKNQSYSVTYRLLTGLAATRNVALTFNFTEAGGSAETRTHQLTGIVLPANVGGAENLGSMTNSTEDKSGIITSLNRSDDEGNTLEQTQPYFAAFEMPAAQSNVDISFTGLSRFVQETNSFTSGKLALILTRDANNDGKLSISEREDSNAIRLTTPQIAQNSSASASDSKTLSSGKFLVFIYTAVMDQTSVTTRELGFNMKLKVDDIAPPAFEVRGNNVIINNNDTTPGSGDGTSFGSVAQGAAPTLTFSVKNTGQATMNIDGQRPNVTGDDFILFEDVLNSTLGAGGTDTFKVKLIDTSPGNKSGTIVIQSSNASGGNFTFAIGGTVDAPLIPSIDVKGNGNSIVNNSRTPSPDNGTQFAEFLQGSGPAPLLTFSVFNQGNAALQISGAPTISGPFQIEDALAGSIAPGASDTFSLRLTETSGGIKVGQVSIASNTGGDANPFVFAIGGTVISASLPPVFAVLTGSALTVTGTSGNDSMTSTTSGSTFKFTRNGADSLSFATSAVTKIVINLLDGNDNYSSATQLDIKQTINGGNGNDLIRGGKQADVLNGNEGDDRMDGRTRGDLFDGGAGSDTAIYRQRRATEPVTVTIDELPNDGGSSDQSKDNVLSSTEHIQGGLGNDRLTGSSKTNRLFGFEGNDTLVGLKGADTLDGGSGANDLNGGFGNDQLFSRNTITDIIDGGADTDSLTGDTIDDISNVENENLA